MSVPPISCSRSHFVSVFRAGGSRSALRDSIACALPGVAGFVPRFGREHQPAQRTAGPAAPSLYSLARTACP
eukprot:9906519-Alexandrium_andersonii.AAC.1